MLENFTACQQTEIVEVFRFFFLPILLMDFYANFNCAQASLNKVCLTSVPFFAVRMINEVIIIMGENHWGSDPGAHLITNFLSEALPPISHL